MTALNNLISKKRFFHIKGAPDFDGVVKGGASEKVQKALL